MDVKRKKQGIGLVILLAIVLVGALCWYAGRPLVQFVSEPELFRAWVDAHGFWGRAAFVGMVMLQVIVAVIPGEPFEIVAGYAFGAVEGTVLCLLGITLGSMAIFFAVRRWGMRLVELFFDREKVLNLPIFQNQARLNAIALIVFAIPGTPKDILTYAVGLTPMRPLPWLLICTVARFPSVVTSTVGGSALGDQNYQFALIVFLVTIAISLCGIWIYHRFEKKRATHG